ERYTELPISIAWDAFGIKNAAASLDIVRASIAKLRRAAPRPWEDYTIGCILLVAPFFWQESQSLPAPEGWAPTIVRGRRYDLQDPIGAHLWKEVLIRLQGMGTVRHVAETRRLVVSGGYGAPVPVPHRIGQGTFRALVTDAYGRKCAVTQEKALPALEAAHIKPFSAEQTHHVRNGLLLRSDVHRLFDSGYITVTPDYRVEASRRMREDFDDGENYLRLHGSSILLPHDIEMRPDPEALRWHNENCFRGG